MEEQSSTSRQQRRIQGQYPKLSNSSPLPPIAPLHQLSPVTALELLPSMNKLPWRNCHGETNFKSKLHRWVIRRKGKQHLSLPYQNTTEAKIRRGRVKGVWARSLVTRNMDGVRRVSGPASTKFVFHHCISRCEWKKITISS